MVWNNERHSLHSYYATCFHTTEQYFLVWPFQSGDISVHNQLITFVYLNDYRQVKCHSSSVVLKVVNIDPQGQLDHPRGR